MARSVAIGLVALPLLCAACAGGEESSGAPAPVPATDERVTIEGKVHCGPVRECTGEAFLVYTEYGGKVLMVTPTADRGAADVRAHLVDGAPVQISGIKKSQVSVHQYEITADQLTFPQGGPDTPRPGSE